MWRRWHARSGWTRIPLKLALFVCVLVLTLFPKPWLIFTLAERARDFNALIDPSHVGLEPFVAEVRAAAAEPNAPPETALVQKVVLQRVPYSFDWETWGVAEYLPTVDDVLRAGREDCDGRAIVAASVLRRMGYDATLVTDLLHMWVVTPQGELMNPTSAQKTLVGGSAGTEFQLTPAAVRNFARGFAFGVAVFPLGRELILAAALCLLTMHPRSSGWRRVSGCLLIWIGLDLVRDRGQRLAYDWTALDVGVVALGVAALLAGWLALAIRAAAAPPRSAVALPQ